MRRRVAGAGSMVAALLASATFLGAPAASAACPNEAFRTGPSAQLPECRAYEMVTPVDKNGGIGIQERSAARAMPSGEGIYFESSAAFADPRGNGLSNGYVASREGETWETRPTSGPLVNRAGGILISTFALSEDLGFAVVASKEAYAPGAIAEGSNLYLRNTRTGASTLIVAVPGTQVIQGWATAAGGADTFSFPVFDGSLGPDRILISSTDVLAPGGVGGQALSSIYESRDGQVRVLVAEAEPAGRTGATPNAVSADGSSFFYVKEGLIYMYRQGQEPLLVSEDEEGAPLSGAVFVGASPDGGVVFFRSADGTLYRFEASAPAASRVTDLTRPLGPAGEEPDVLKATASEGGTFVYFAAKGQLTSDARPLGVGPGLNLYVWHGASGGAGEIRYLGQSEAPRGLGDEGVSPDGEFFGLEAYGDLTPEVTEGDAERCPAPESGEEPAGDCANVFLYSYAANRIVCVTCTGSAPNGPSRLGGSAQLPYTLTAPRAVLDDGTIFFDTPNALVPRDVNGVLDAYMWREGRPQLISTGTAATPSSFTEASANGSDVFFQTSQALVGQDVDSSIDLYDARVDGGLPQGGAVTASPCASEASCRGGAAPGSPQTATDASEAVHGARNVAGACLDLRGKARVAARRSHVLARRAGHADGRRAKALREGSSREARRGRRLGRRAHTCTGGGR